MVNSKKGKDALRESGAQVTTFAADTSKMLRHNPSIEVPAVMHRKREAFFRYYTQHGFSGEYVMKLLAGPGMAERVIRRIAHLPVGAMRRIKRLLTGGQR